MQASQRFSKDFLHTIRLLLIVHEGFFEGTSAMCLSIASGGIARRASLFSQVVTNDLKTLLDSYRHITVQKARFRTVLIEPPQHFL